MTGALTLGEVCIPSLMPLGERAEDGPFVFCALLTAIESRPDCRRSIFGCGVAAGEAEIHHWQFLKSPRTRGMAGERATATPSSAPPWTPCYPA